MRNALEIARQVRAGHVSAETWVHQVIADVARRDAQTGSCFALFNERALRDARRVDRMVREGCDPGVLAGVPFLVKSNLDVAGYVTVAGSPARVDHPAASVDAVVVDRLRNAGAVVVGATHMDELACGATGENPHFGAVRLPQDPSRMTGGSSSGSAAAVAAGFVPLALGSDTNGSIRAPAALCGVWAIKPGVGVLPRAGCVPYADTLDVLGGFANSIDDLAALYQALLGDDRRGLEPRTPPTPLRIGILTGDFERFSNVEAHRAVQRAAARFERPGQVPIDSALAAEVRAAAVVVSNVEVARSHRALLDADASLVSPRLRVRLTAGLHTSEAQYASALACREAWLAHMLGHFTQYDVLIAPATPYPAPRFIDTHVDVNGAALEPATSLGMLTQPISFAGLPVVSAPMHASGELPVGVQVICAPGHEASCFAAARRLA